MQATYFKCVFVPLTGEHAQLLKFCVKKKPKQLFRLHTLGINLLSLKTDTCCHIYLCKYLILLLNLNRRLH